MRTNIWNLLQRAAGPLPFLLGVIFATPAAATDLLPRQVGSYAIASTPNRLAVSGTRAYVTYTEWNSNTGVTVGTLLILDITNPREPTFLGTYTRSNYYPQGVTVRGNLAYLAAGDDGLAVIDVSDPTAPRRIGGYNTSGQAWQVFLVGNYAYVADGDAGLVVIDVSNPASPRRVGGLDGVGEVWELFVSGNYAYLADRFGNGTGESQPYGALRIMDISNPASPKLVGTHETEGEAFYVFVAGNIAYVGASRELELFDVSDPVNPVHIGNYGVGQTQGVLSGNRAYMSGPVGLQVLDISNPASPRRLGGLPQAWLIAVAGQYAYTIANGGLAVIDLAPPANLPRVGSLNTPDYARDVAVAGTRAYVADSTAGMQILDITDPRQPLLLGSYATANLAELVAANGNYAYVVETWPIAGTSYGCALHVVDVSDPASPRQVGAYETSGYFPRGWWVNSRALAVGATGDYAFLSVPNEAGYGSSGRIEVIDLRTPSDPQLAATYDVASYVNDVTLHGQYLLVCQADGLLVLDVSNPAAPQAAGSYNSASCYYRVTASGTRAYATGDAGFQVLDLSDPAHPSLLGVNTNLAPARSWTAWTGRLAASGNYVYGAAAGSGVQVVDISDPTNPRLVGGNSAVLASDLAISGNHVFVAGYAEGLQVFDVLLYQALPLPALSMIRSGDALLITWPTSVSGAVLETTNTLSPTASWVPVAAAPVTIGDETAVAVDIEGGMKFYRLRKP